MATLTGHQHQTSEQHVELETSRLKRDNTDVINVQQWSDQYWPNLKSIYSRVIASSESGINCDEIEKVGEKLNNLSRETANVKNEDMTKTLENLNTGIVVEEETIHINPMIMFVRMMLILQRESEPYFTYGLTPVPTAIFKDNTSMREASKALLTKVLLQIMFLMEEHFYIEATKLNLWWCNAPISEIY